MEADHSNQEKGKSKNPTVLVAVDFSYCSRLALRKGKSWAAANHGRILVLHVIDRGFVRHCIEQKLGTEEEVKRKLFLNAKKKLHEFILREGMDGNEAQTIICEGMPCVEINAKAVENDVDMIVMGSKGNSDDMKSIFFGSTTEKVLRFIKRPVLCVPPEFRHRLK